MVERERHERHRNLVVAATGTGKTVVAALDYRQLVSAAGGPLPALRRSPRGDPAAVAGHLSRGPARWVVWRDSRRRPDRGGRHVFAMVQSLQLDRLERDRTGRLRRRRRGRVPSRRGHDLRPAPQSPPAAELLGLTATPERLDGKDVTEWFDERIAVELRLWEAIDQGFLVPFQYFGVADGTDLRQLSWRRGGYAPRSSATSSPTTTSGSRSCWRLFSAIVLEPDAMRALGFCVSKEHAHYMARKFTEAALESVALTGDDAPD